MAGRGPAPKDPARRARTNAGPAPAVLLRFERVERPELSAQYEWPARTQEWFEMWRASPQADTFSSTDWDFLIDTALVHAAFWGGDLSVAGELRIRVAKFGATPEDRARLRMQFAQADEAEDRRDAKRSSSARDRRGGLTAAG